MDLSDLRQAAIDMLGDQQNENGGATYQKSPAELIYELQVHQAELEMQNEELRRVQRELEDSRDRFAAFFDFTPTGYVTLDPQGRIVEANLRFAKMVNVERGKLSGRALAQFVVVEDAPALDRHLRDGAARSSCEVTLRKADGRLFRARLDSVASVDDIRAVAIMDMTENAELVRAKQDTDERLRVIHDTLPIPIAYIDCAETYQFINPAYERWFNMTRQLIAGRHIKAILGEATYAKLQGPIRRALDGQTCSGTFQLAVPGSEPRQVEVYYAPHHDQQKGVVGFYEVMFDVSARRQAEAEESLREELQSRLASLTVRQRAVFDLLMSGHSNKAITHALDVGMRTVERERHEILHLLGASSINEMLVRFAGLASLNHSPKSPPDNDA